MLQQAVAYPHQLVGVIEKRHDPWHRVGVTAEQAEAGQAQGHDPIFFRTQGSMRRHVVARFG
ncbi:hypothetical protein D3C86_1843860 [compost metagenome]